MCAVCVLVLLLCLQEEFENGFGSHTPMYSGQTKCVRYYMNFHRAMDLAKECLLEVGGACGCVFFGGGLWFTGLGSWGRVRGRQGRWIWGGSGGDGVWVEVWRVGKGRVGGRGGMLLQEVRCIPLAQQPRCCVACA